MAHILSTNKNARWVKAELEGDFLCPDCKTIMVIIGMEIWAYAYCPKCNQYWKSTN